MSFFISVDSKTSLNTSGCIFLSQCLLFTITMLKFPVAFLEREWNNIPKKSGGTNKTFLTSTPVSTRNRYSALEVEEDDDDDIDLLLDELELPMPRSKKMRKSNNVSPPGGNISGKTQMLP